MIDAFDIIAFVVFAVTPVAVVVIVVTLGSLPGQIAHKRGHPQAAAITVAGWLGLVTGGIVWPLALIWAFLRPIAVGPGPGRAATRPARGFRREGGDVMVTCMCLIYAGLATLLFKYKILKVRPYAIAWVAVGGVLLIGGVVVVWRLCAPTSSRVVSTQYVVQLVSLVKGQVLKVHARANQPVKKGDLLLEIEPEPFQYTVNQVEAQLAAARDHVKLQQASVAAADAGVVKAGAGIRQARAAVSQAKAGLANAQAGVRPERQPARGGDARAGGSRAAGHRGRLPIPSEADRQRRVYAHTGQ
ncbi:MAG TPA: DUF3302 domain-containing protein [Gemmataceae bacterium]|nr:DUF3302 domain-containing protein [Gemmataceae bacterium]